MEMPSTITSERELQLCFISAWDQLTESRRSAKILRRASVELAVAVTYGMASKEYAARTANCAAEAAVNVVIQEIAATVAYMEFIKALAPEIVSCIKEVVVELLKTFDEMDEANLKEASKRNPLDKSG